MAHFLYSCGRATRNGSLPKLLIRGWCVLPPNKKKMINYKRPNIHHFSYKREKLEYNFYTFLRRVVCCLRVWNRKIKLHHLPTLDRESQGNSLEIEWGARTFPFCDMKENNNFRLSPFTLNSSTYIGNAQFSLLMCCAYRYEIWEFYSPLNVMREWFWWGVLRERLWLRISCAKKCLCRCF